MIKLVKMKMTTKIVFGNTVSKKKLTKIFPKHVRFVFKDSRLKISAFIQNNESF